MTKPSHIGGYISANPPQAKVILAGMESPATIPLPIGQIYLRFERQLQQAFPSFKSINNTSLTVIK